MPLHSTPYPRVSRLDNSEDTKSLEQLRNVEHTTQGIDISKLDTDFRQSSSGMDSFIEGTTDEQEDCQDFVRKLSFDSSVDHLDLNRGDLTSPSEPDLSNFVLNITAVISEEI